MRKWALAECKVVVPVLRLGDYSLLPPELKRFHCPDFRDSRQYTEALNELVRILNQPVVPLGSLAGKIPSLPAFYQPRPDDMLALSQTILADVRGPVVTGHNKGLRRSLQELDLLENIGSGWEIMMLSCTDAKNLDPFRLLLFAVAGWMNHQQ